MAELRPLADDPGRQPERTLMAWVRTGSALAAVSLLFTRLVSRSAWPVLALTLAGLAVATAVVVLQDRRHHRRITRALEPALVSVSVLTAVIVALAVAAALLVLL